LQRAHRENPSFAIGFDHLQKGHQGDAFKITS